MRESFVFHAEYIADLPDDYKADFAMYAINYALNDEQPPLMQGTLEYSLWAKIERRINQEREKYERVKERRTAAGRAHKGNQYTNAPKEEPNPAEEKREEAPAEKRKRVVFVPPTLEEVNAYCKERNNGISGERFIEYYTNKRHPWTIGNQKEPMRDWRAAVRQWERTERKNESKQAGALWGNENEVPEDIINSI